VATDTEDQLRRAGGEGFELFVVWSGVVDGDRFMVRNGHVPRQTSAKTKNGLMVRVDGAALHKLNVWLYEHGETLGAQVHAHPDDAYHSGTDDTFPIVTMAGGLSLVVPEFCRGGLLSGSAAFRLDATGWTASDEPAKSLIEVL
jgi:hypothetical protein